MEELKGWGHQDASQLQCQAIAGQIVDEAFAGIRPALVGAVAAFLAGPLTPASFLHFERTLLSLVRELGRVVLQGGAQSLEAEDPHKLPYEVLFEGDGYRRRRDQTRNAHIATRLGNIVLWRRGYRSWQRGEATIFPIERMLGLVHSVSPALLVLLGRSLASAGMSQQATLTLLQEQCGVSLGVKRSQVRILSARLS